jgi:hypothetical protein
MGERRMGFRWKPLGVVEKTGEDFSGRGGTGLAGRAKFWLKLRIRGSSYKKSAGTGRVGAASERGE